MLWWLRIFTYRAGHVVWLSTENDLSNYRKTLWEEPSAKLSPKMGGTAEKNVKLQKLFLSKKGDIHTLCVWHKHEKSTATTNLLAFRARALILLSLCTVFKLVSLQVYLIIIPLTSTQPHIKQFHVKDVGIELVIILSSYANIRTFICSNMA